eukprot:jgi/Botrbrau1/10166/Bobra.0121s0018.2
MWPVGILQVAAAAAAWPVTTVYITVLSVVITFCRFAIHCNPQLWEDLTRLNEKMEEAVGSFRRKFLKHSPKMDQDRASMAVVGEWSGVTGGCVIFANRHTGQTGPSSRGDGPDGGQQCREEPRLCPVKPLLPARGALSGRFHVPLLLLFRLHHQHIWAGHVEPDGGTGQQIWLGKAFQSVGPSQSLASCCTGSARYLCSLKARAMVSVPQCGYFRSNDVGRRCCRPSPHPSSHMDAGCLRLTVPRFAACPLPKSTRAYMIWPCRPGIQSLIYIAVWVTVLGNII